MSDLVEFSPPRSVASSDRRVLVVFDGGDAPGYSSVAVALTEEGTRRGYEVWAAAEGFRSLTRDAAANPRFERLIVGRQERYALLGKGIPARSMGRRVLDAGSDFRSERYDAFLERGRRREAAETFRMQGFTHLVCVGGNGTLEGTKALLEELPAPPPTAFVNVSIDNDLAGDRAIGFLSGVEAGATIARGLLEDAYTHKRIYILEMMGNRSGRHALHCGVAARAHLIVLPFFRFTDEVVAEAAAALSRVDYALVVVAEGYEAERRRSMDGMSASQFFKTQLAAAGLRDGGLRDGDHKRVIAEPYSRFLARPPAVVRRRIVGVPQSLAALRRLRGGPQGGGSLRTCVQRRRRPHVRRGHERRRGRARLLAAARAPGIAKIPGPRARTLHVRYVSVRCQRTHCAQTWSQAPSGSMATAPLKIVRRRRNKRSLCHAGKVLRRLAGDHGDPRSGSKWSIPPAAPRRVATNRARFRAGASRRRRRDRRSTGSVEGSRSHPRSVSIAR